MKMLISKVDCSTFSANNLIFGKRFFFHDLLGVILLNSFS